jgi:hypothetical protein
MGKLDQIKAAQLAEAEKSGVNPYTDGLYIGIDMAAGADSTVVYTDLESMQSAMEIDLGKISAAKDINEKIRLKKLFLPTYMDFVNDYINQGYNYPCDVAVHAMVWLLDAGEIETGLNIALTLVKQNQRMPARFDRDMPTFLCDFFYDWANQCLKEGNGVSPYLDVLVATAENDKWDVHPLCISKIQVMLAKHKEIQGDYATALELCKKAEAVNPEGAGVKGMTKRLTAQLEKVSSAPGTEAKAD